MLRYGIYLLLMTILIPVSSLWATSSYPVVFLHGIGGGYMHWRPMIETLNVDQAPTYELRYFSADEILHNVTDLPRLGQRSYWNVSYYSQNVLSESFGGNLTQYADRLGVLIGHIQRLTGQDKVVIVAHSMGGVVARRYMTQSDAHWSSVHRILTVGSPNEGVLSSVGVVGQLIDLKANSRFIEQLNKDWLDRQHADGVSKWGVLGGVHFWGKMSSIQAHTTDHGGLGFMAISSAIPFGEWAEAAGHIGFVDRNTDHFAYRACIRATHLGLLKADATREAIEWAMDDQ